MCRRESVCERGSEERERERGECVRGSEECVREGETERGYVR